MVFKPHSSPKLTILLQGYDGGNNVILNEGDKMNRKRKRRITPPGFKQMNSCMRYRRPSSYLNYNTNIAALTSGNHDQFMYITHKKSQKFSFKL